MANNKITLEDLFNLLNSVPSADKSSVIDVVYSAAKIKIEELVQNYNQIYTFYQQLTSFSILTGEQFKVVVPDVVDYKIVSSEIQNTISEKTVGSSESVHENEPTNSSDNTTGSVSDQVEDLDPCNDNNGVVTEKENTSPEQSSNGNEPSLDIDKATELSQNNDLKDELPEDFGAFPGEELPETSKSEENVADPEDPIKDEEATVATDTDNDSEIELLITKVNEADVPNETKDLLNLLIKKVLKNSEKQRVA